LFRLYRLLCIAFLTLVSLPASAQYTRDTAANKKIDEAINQHYVATDFEKAEGVLLGTINACGDKCSPAVFARAWMYVGIVRGSGKNNQPGAKEAFQKAAAADPSIKLDMVLATPETQATFNAVAGGGGGQAPAPGGVEPAEPEPTEDGAAPVAGGGGGLECTPGAMQVETRRPIPIQCQSDEEVGAMEVKYKAFGSDTWKTLPMQKKGDVFRATIPCTATGIAGSLRVYVRAKDKSGEQVDTWGTKQAPNEFALAEGVTEEPPAFDGEEPPARCQEAGECPPDFPGCSSGKSECEGRGNGDWGAACENSVECKCGLLCTDGTCETAPSCETDEDCSTGTCIGGKCDIGGAGGVGPKADYKKNWLGIHFAQDFAIVGGNNVCDSNLGQKSSNYACFYEGTSDKPFVHTPFPYRDGIQQGMVLATSRILLSYDRAFFPWLTAEIRAGFAFGGGPPAGQQVKKVAGVVPDRATGTGGTPFLPAHVEVKGKYWIVPLTSKFFRAYVGLGGGMAQVDAKVSIPEYDCTHAGNPDKNPERAAGQQMNWDPDDPPVADGDELTPFQQCRQGKGYYNYRYYKPVMVDGWKKMGQAFGTGSLGAVLAFKENMGVAINANVMYMLPASGLVIEPSLGFTYGL
jgi:hypothetical protein